MRMRLGSRRTALVTLASVMILPLLNLSLVAQEPPHPILNISGSGSGADNILNTYTESQYLQLSRSYSDRRGAAA